MKSLYNLFTFLMIVFLIVATVALIRDTRPYNRGNPDPHDNFVSAPLDLWNVKGD